MLASRRIHWDAKFHRPPQDWEQESFDLFMDMVYSLTIWGLGPNRVCWKPARNRGFEVRGFYLSFYPPTLLSFPWRMIWKLKVPPRVAFFSWSASLGKILTTDNICKLICTICVRIVGSQWIIFFFINPLLVSCGCWSFVCLEFIGLCLRRLLSCLSLGRVGLDDLEI